jgi:hypothetical protein
MKTSNWRVVWTLAVATALAVFLMAAPAAAQQPEEKAGEKAAPGAQAQDEQALHLERLAPGFGIREISVYGGGYSLQQSATSSLGSGTPRYMGVGGAGVELGWRPSSRTNLADIRYRLDQNWNTAYSGLSGMDHYVIMTSASGLGTRWRRGFTLNAESRLYSSMLFASPVLPAGASAAAGGPSSAGTSLGDSGVVLNSPLTASFFGSRRNAGGAGFDVSFAKSPRTTWFTAANISHQMAAAGASGDQSSDLLHPAVTMGTATAGLAHAYSRSTTIGFDVSAARSESRIFKTLSGAVMGNVTRELKSGLSVFVRAGYSLADHLDRPDRAARGVQGSAGITGTRGIHTVRLSAYEDRMDRFALGAERNTGGDAIWNVIGRSSPWSSSLSFGYIRTTRPAAPTVEGVVARGLISRRVARDLSLGFDVAYATVAGRIPTLLSDLTQGGVRVFLSYTPQP